MRRLGILVIIGLGVGAASGCECVRSAFGQPGYEARGDPSDLQPTFDGADASRERIGITLTEVAQGVEQVTDLQFSPGDPGVLVALEKGGVAEWIALDGGGRGELFRKQVVSGSEAGLLGLAFHPGFAENGRLFANWVVEKDGGPVTQVVELRVPGGKVFGATAVEEAVLLEVAQPYLNHDAGQLAFGPDGMLYVGFGDGGSGGDPHGHGQNPKTFLGSMLRLDVDRKAEGKAYGLPEDNPRKEGWPPETFAIGLRNPWRFSFDPKGRLVTGDVGQNKWEEVSIVPSGGNLGWNRREGRHCFPPGRECSAEGFVEPVYEYGREEGRSITGGYVYSGSRVPALRGKYVFADFTDGRIWAIELPEQVAPPPKMPQARALGRWPLLISTFGRAPNGELYVGDFGQGRIFRIDPSLGP